MDKNNGGLLNSIIQKHQSFLGGGKEKISYSWLKLHPLETIRYYHFLLQTLEQHQGESPSHPETKAETKDKTKRETKNFQVSGKLFSLLPIRKYKTACLEFQPKGFYSFVKKLGFKPGKVENSLPQRIKTKRRQEEAWNHYLRWTQLKSKKWNFAENLATDGVKASLLFSCPDQESLVPAFLSEKKSKKRKSTQKIESGHKQKVNLASPLVTKGLYIDTEVCFDFKASNLQRSDIVLKVVDPGRNPDIITWVTGSLDKRQQRLFTRLQGLNMQQNEKVKWLHNQHRDISVAIPNIYRKFYSLVMEGTELAVMSRKKAVDGLGGT